MLISIAYHARGNVRIILRITIGTNISIMCCIISLLSQGFAGPAFFFFLSCSAIGTATSLTITIWTQFRVYFAVSRQRFPENLGRILVFLSISLIALPFIFVIFLSSFLSNPSIFNLLVAIGITLIPLQLVVTSPLLFLGAHRLIREAEENIINLSRQNSMNYQKSINFLTRLKRFRLGMSLTIISELSFCITIPLLNIYYKLPYLGWIVCVLGTSSLLWCTFIFAITSRPLSLTAKTNNSSNFSQLSKAEQPVIISEAS